MLLFKEKAMKYIHRWMEDRIVQTLEINPVVILTGPRQVGKSTLLEQADFLKDWRYLTLDDPDILEQAHEDPKGLLWKEQSTIIDEVQRCPELLLTVKYLVDQSQRKRKFILSGSGNVSLRQRPRETLAGRVNYLDLMGFNMRELQGLPADGILNQIWEDREIQSYEVGNPVPMAPVIWRGSLPGVVLAPTEKIALGRGKSYIDTYLSRDIQDLVKIRHPENFRRLMEVLAQATGWESVQEQLSKVCGETRTNVSRYLSLLQDTKLLHELRGYTSRGERAYKQSKYYWFDSGAACLLAGINSPEALNKPNIKGRYFENYIFQQIYTWVSLQMIMPELFYWKPKSGDAEVDFVVRSSQNTIGIEVKSSDQVDFGDTRSMREFLKTHPEASKGIIVYAGSKVYPIATNIYAVPWGLI
jgi:predicted AAA+ superfamily ATPase